MIYYDSLARWLRVISLVYLSLPLGLFILLYVRMGWGLPLTGLLIWAVVVEMRRCVKQQQPELAADNSRLDPRSLLFCIVPCILLACISGAGRWGHQDGDWVKHESIMHDLIQSSGPVIYRTEEGPVMLIYYIAYYLPAVVAGKLWGWHAANQVLFATTLIGIILAGLWACVLTRAKPWIVGLVFPLFSGMDIVGGSLFPKHMSHDHLEWWAKPIQFSSTSALVFYVPNQAIPGWLLTSFLWQDFSNNEVPRTAVLSVALAVLWSPFVALGLMPLLAWGSLKQMLRPKAWFSAANLVGVVLLIVFVIYFFARVEPHPTFAPPEFLERERLKFLFPIMSTEKMIWFVLLEFLILHVLLYVSWFSLKRHPSQLWLLPAATLSLLGMLIFHYGRYNDLAMRASIPALWITLLSTLTILAAQDWLRWRRTMKICIAIVLIIGAATSLVEFRRKIRGGVELLSVSTEERTTPPEHTLWELHNAKYRVRFAFFNQYIGAGESLFAIYLAAPTAEEIDSPPPEK